MFEGKSFHMHTSATGKARRPTVWHHERTDYWNYRLDPADNSFIASVN